MPGSGGSDPGGAPAEEGNTDDKSAAPEVTPDEDEDGIGRDTP